MAVIIRLQPKKASTFRIVVMEKKTRRDGRYISQIGFIDNDSAYLNLKELTYWIGLGSQLSYGLMKKFQVYGIWDILKTGKYGAFNK